jgi:hypothetical protein
MAPFWRSCSRSRCDLPPVADQQLATAKKYVQRSPLIVVGVATALVIPAAWRLRFAIAIASVITVVAVVQITYYLVTPQPGRAAASRAVHWRTSRSRQVPGAPSKTRPMCSNAAGHEHVHDGIDMWRETGTLGTRTTMTRRRRFHGGWPQCASRCRAQSYWLERRPGC